MNGERRNNMRKYFCILLCGLFVLTATFGQAFAATMFQTDGIYGVEIDAKIKVKKAGGDKSSSSGDVDIVASTATTGTFALDDFAVPNTVAATSTIITGTLTLFKGKKVEFAIDGAGFNAISATIFRWISILAANDGIIINSATITIFLPIKTSKFKVDKNTGIPKGKAKLKLKGQINANTNQGTIIRDFKYQTKVGF